MVNIPLKCFFFFWQTINNTLSFCKFSPILNMFNPLIFYRKYFRKHNQMKTRCFFIEVKYLKMIAGRFKSLSSLTFFTKSFLTIHLLYILLTNVRKTQDGVKVSKICSKYCFRQEHISSMTTTVFSVVVQNYLSFFCDENTIFEVILF